MQELDQSSGVSELVSYVAIAKTGVVNDKDCYLLLLQGKQGQVFQMLLVESENGLFS